jgi:hypothetical protein
MRARARKTIEPLLGPSAAEDAVRAWKSLRMGLFTTAVMGPIGIGGALARFWPIVIFAVSCELFVGGAFSIQRTYWRHKFFKDAGRSLGIKIRWYSGLPQGFQGVEMRRSSLEKWCTKKGLTFPENH